MGELPCLVLCHESCVIMLSSALCGLKPVAVQAAVNPVAWAPFVAGACSCDACDNGRNDLHASQNSPRAPAC